MEGKLSKEQYDNLTLEEKVNLINNHLNDNNGDYKSLDFLIWKTTSKQEQKYLSSSYVTQQILSDYKYDRKTKNYLKKEDIKQEVSNDINNTNETFKDYIIDNIFKQKEDKDEKKVIFKIFSEDECRLNDFLNTINLNKKTLLNYIYKYQISQLDTNSILENILELNKNIDNKSISTICFNIEVDVINELQDIYNELYFIKKEQIDIAIINHFLNTNL